MKPSINKRFLELRNTEFGTNDEMTVTGYGAVFEKPTVLYKCDDIEYKEVIDRNAFNQADFSDCCLKYNHKDSVPVLARVRGGSLKPSVDDYGLKFEAKLFNTSIARDIYAIMKEGGIDKCSFAFTVKKSEYDTETHTRRILEIDKVFDISLVDIPAYADTDVKARDFFAMEIEKEKEELDSLKDAEIRKRIEILSY